MVDSALATWARNLRPFCAGDPFVAAGIVRIESSRGTLEIPDGAPPNTELAVTGVGSQASGEFSVVNICSLPGDSGGAVFAHEMAHGIMGFSNFEGSSDSPRCADEPRTTYSQIHYVQRDLGQSGVDVWLAR